MKIISSTNDDKKINAILTDGISGHEKHICGMALTSDAIIPIKKDQIINNRILANLVPMCGTYSVQHRINPHYSHEPCRESFQQII